MNARTTLSLATLFAALSSGNVAAQTFSSLPDQGPLEDKTCKVLNYDFKPGSIISMEPMTKQQAASRGYASILGNDCKIRTYRIDAAGNVTQQGDNTARSPKPNAPTSTTPTTVATGIPATPTTTPG